MVLWFYFVWIVDLLLKYGRNCKKNWKDLIQLLEPLLVKTNVYPEPVNTTLSPEGLCMWKNVCQKDDILNIALFFFLFLFSSLATVGVNKQTKTTTNISEKNNI